MSRKAPNTNRQVLEEASTWFVTFRTQPVDEDARQDFHEWLKRSPEHIRAYLEIASTYADIPSPENGRTPSEFIARAKSSPDVNVVSLASDKLATYSPPTPSWPGRVAPARPMESHIRPRAFAAALVLLFGSVGAWLYAERNTYATAIGEQRSITLPDGSIVELNARSRIRVEYRAGERDVELLSGQALFRVAKDPSRPFVVSTDDARVRAVGTQFDVFRKAGGTVVTVLEGRVRVVRPTGESPQGTAQPTPPVQTALAAGEQMTVTPTSAHKVESPNLAAATAWTRHQLVFDGTPLSEVIEEFSRYSRRRLVIDSAELAKLKISGQYISADPQSLLRFLSLQKGVTVTEINGETHIRRE